MATYPQQTHQCPPNELIGAALRLSGTLLSIRDKLVRDIGLTSARWQVLGEVSSEALPLSVAQIARRIGLSRQAVQRTTNELVAAGMATFSDDPRDRRSQLVAITEKGQSAITTANSRQAAWMETFSDALDGDSVRSAEDFLRVAEVVAGKLPEPQGRVEMAVPSLVESVESVEYDMGSLPSPPRPQIKKARAFEGVSSHILSKIKSGMLVSGDKLPAERDLAAALSVGRPAVREALRSLEMSGVLRFERGASGGAFVRETGSDGMALSIRNMLLLGRLPPFDLNEVRACLLGQSARLGADRGTEADFAALERNINAIDAHRQLGEAATTEIIAFYRLVGTTTHNPLMIILTDAIAEVMHEMLIDLKIRTTIDVVTPRRDMLTAMRARRPEDAERAIRLHFEETGALLLDYKPTTSGGWVRTGMR